MKKILGTLACLLTGFAVFSQTIHGKIKSTNGNTLQGATIVIQSGNNIIGRFISHDGTFKIPFIQNAVAVFEYAGKTSKTIQLSNNTNTVDVVLEDEPYFLQPLEVKALRVNEKAPFTKTDLAKAQIEKQNLGQDIPFLLNLTPSVVVNSDAGNGVGYTGMRIRGTDATRINVTLNGIPYNDAESQGTFFVNLPDFTSSVNSIQIQRGAGPSTNGAGAFGATLNISTNQVNKTAYAEANNAFGSFNTWKNTIKAGTGLINDKFTFDVRLSRISSDGYVDRASSDLQAFYTSAAYIGKNSSLRLNVFSGKEKTYQAWNGIPEAFLTTNRTYNSAGTEKPGEPYDNETDNYTQTHYQLFWNQKINTKLALNVAGFLTRGKGYYEQYKADQSFSKYNLPNFTIGGTTVTKTDLVRQLWLDNYFYGSTFSLQYQNNNHEITWGGGISKYDGSHYGKIIWAKTGIEKDFRYYDLDANKSDINSYIKWQYNINNNWSFYTDLQYRHVTHNMYGFRNNTGLVIKRNFDFVNPKAGISYAKGNEKVYFSYAMANKEPNRDDFEAGLLQQPKHETMHDFELGYEKRTSKYTYGATVYYMFYKNQLILTGQINDVGAYTRTNVPNSYRTGIELEGSVYITKWLNASANFTYSRNRIVSFNEFIDDYDNNNQKTVAHKNTSIALSPDIIASSAVNIIPAKHFEISLLNKYVGKQYLDNTGNEDRKLNAFFLQDVRVSYNLYNTIAREWNFIFQVNNVFNKRYEPNGYTFTYIYGGETTTENYYYPMAGTNFTLGVNLKF